MGLYADHPLRRTRQIIADLLALGWLVACVAAGLAVHGLLVGIAAPLHRMAEVGAGIDESMSDIAATATDVPMLGAQLGTPFQDAASAGQRLRDAGLDGAALVDGLAVLLGIAVAAIPALLVLLPWLVLRTRFARLARELRRLADHPAGLELLALRALVSQPPSRLTASAPDPAAAWRAGNTAAVQRLALLELDRLGLRG